MFAEREWLAAELERGKSLEQIGRETGRHPSTVGYWAHKHGLCPQGAEKFARRGPPDRQRLEALAASGASLKAIARELDRSIATIRHWLRRWDIERPDARRRQLAPDAPREIVRDCLRHGRTGFAWT